MELTIAIMQKKMAVIKINKWHIGNSAGVIKLILQNFYLSLYLVEKCRKIFLNI